jgi:CRP/FNR family transcriptional regulator, cyclic AMP receptor protein
VKRLRSGRTELPGPLRASVNFCQVLRAEPDLLQAIAPAQQDQAIDACIAPVAYIARGRWTGHWETLGTGAIGLLVLEGLLVRRVGIDKCFGAELLGQGDILRPWETGSVNRALPHTTGWRVLEPTRLAVLDARVARRFALYPPLTGRLVDKALARSRSLALTAAIINQPRVEVRLHMLFWHLAERWGRVRSDGVVVTVRLTHSVLAELVAARRPTVTSALSKLAGKGLVRSVDREWILTGEPPTELVELQGVAFKRTGTAKPG